jgi:ABC-type branched-subunit amino acid transport system substrate-binding protein
MKSHGFPVRFFLAALTPLMMSSANQAEPLGAAEARGKRIYLEGISSRDRPITARVGREGIALEGSALPCANCHGRDGLGKTEGGLEAPNITWPHLTKPYGHTHPLGRTHAPFTEKSLASAITQGRDPSGNRLDASMPRYALGPRDLADLIAYLKRVETSYDTGVTQTGVRLGVILPQTITGQGIRTTLIAYFERVNAEGGHYGRKIELVFADPASNRLIAARRLIEEQQVFAIIGFGGGAQAELAALARQADIPLIEPTLDFAEPESVANPFTFYLLSGLEDQGAALIEYAARTLGSSGAAAAILHAPDQEGTSLARRLAARGAAKGLQNLQTMDYADDPGQTARLVTTLRERGVGAVIYLAPGNGLASFLERAAGQGWTPSLWVPGAVAGSVVVNTPAEFRKRLYLAYPTLPIDRSPDAMAKLAVLAGTRHPQHPQVLAYALARVFEEGLRRSGRHLGRETLISSLEALGRYETGLTPRIAFGRGRRIGARGAYIVPFEAQGAIQPIWISIED